jgi:hypothetical protein
MWQIAKLWLTLIWNYLCNDSKLVSPMNLRMSQRDVPGRLDTSPAQHMSALAHSKFVANVHRIEDCTHKYVPSFKEKMLQHQPLTRRRLIHIDPG